jgi:hypothetical protein
MQQPDIIVGEDGDADDLEHGGYQWPLLGMEAHGSAGSR